MLLLVAYNAVVTELNFSLELWFNMLLAASKVKDAKGFTLNMLNEP